MGISKKIIIILGVAAICSTVCVGLYAFQKYLPATGTWYRISRAAAFDSRDSASSITANGRMILSGGFVSSSLPALRDIWTSANGEEWTRVAEQAPIPDYAVLVSNGSEVLATGPSTWRASDDLSTWEHVSDDGASKGRYPGFAFWDGAKYTYFGENIVSYSPDGKSWVWYRPPYAPRTHYAAVFHDGKYFVVAGADEDSPADPPEAGYVGTTTFNEVWSSNDGIRWQRVLADAPWSKRMWPLVRSVGDYMVLIGGYSNVSDQNLGDVWVSRDGVDWQQVAQRSVSPGYFPSARHFASGFVLNERTLLMVAGNAWPIQNDVWKFELDTPRSILRDWLDPVVDAWGRFVDR